MISYFQDRIFEYSAVLCLLLIIEMIVVVVSAVKNFGCKFSTMRNLCNYDLDVDFSLLFEFA